MILTLGKNFIKPDIRGLYLSCLFWPIEALRMAEPFFDTLWDVQISGNLLVRLFNLSPENATLLRSKTLAPKYPKKPSYFVYFFPSVSVTLNFVYLPFPISYLKNLAMGNYLSFNYHFCYEAPFCLLLPRIKSLWFHSFYP